jgi:competence protein ComEA
MWLTDKGVRRWYRREDPMKAIVRASNVAMVAALAILLLAWAPLSQSQAASPPKGDPARPAAQQQIDINRANVEELTTIPGIGTALAQRIVDFRDQHGPFGRVEDLLKVKGIGEKSFQKIRPYVKVSGSR